MKELIKVPIFIIGTIVSLVTAFIVFCIFFSISEIGGIFELIFGILLSLVSFAFLETIYIRLAVENILNKDKD